MTLIELLVLLLMVAMGVVIARTLYPIAGMFLAIPGFIAGVMLIPAVIFGYVKYRRRTYCGDKPMPECACGSTAFRYEKIGNGNHLLCRGCRTRYQKRRNVVWVFEGGEKKLYKTLVKHRGWV